MTPSQIIALVRDALIIGALAFIVWWIHEAGANSVKVEDMQAVQKQITANAAQVAAWHQEALSAEAQRTQDMERVTAAISQQRAPVFLQSTPTAACPSAVPAHPATTASPIASSGGPDAGPGIDLRPAINRFELKYEKALADCRSVLAQWPK